MSRRAVEWNKGLAKDLKNKQFAQSFLFACLDEGLNLNVALSKVIKSYGIKEFSKKIGMPSSNLLRVLSPKYNPTQLTLNLLLKPFGLTLAVKPIHQTKAA